jgi:hypothetical protein
MRLKSRTDRAEETEMENELGKLRPTDRVWHLIADCKKPFRPGPLLARSVIRMLFGIKENRNDLDE